MWWNSQKPLYVIGARDRSTYSPVTFNLEFSHLQHCLFTAVTCSFNSLMTGFSWLVTCLLTLLGCL